eukprot:scaffold55589_cov57-Phaeocystis_antarctica.AAC.4
MSHEEAHETIMKPGLATHSPIDAQWPHSGALSAHFGSGVGATGLPPGTSPGSSLPPGLGRDFSSRGFSTRGFRSTGGFRSIGGGCSIVLTGLVIVKRDTPKHTAAMAAAAAPASVVVLWDGRFAGFGALPLFLFAQAFASFVIVRALQCNAHPSACDRANTARCEELPLACFVSPSQNLPHGPRCQNNAKRFICLPSAPSCGPTACHSTGA